MYKIYSVDKKLNDNVCVPSTVGCLRTSNRNEPVVFSSLESSLSGKTFRKYFRFIKRMYVPPNTAALLAYKAIDTKINHVAQYNFLRKQLFIVYFCKFTSLTMACKLMLLRQLDFVNMSTQSFRESTLRSPCCCIY